MRILLILLGMVAAPAWAELAAQESLKPNLTQGGDVVAVVNGQVIPKMVEEALYELTIKDRKDTPLYRKQLREEIIRRTLIAQEAVKKGYGEYPDASKVKTVAQGKTFLVQQGALIGAYARDYINNHPGILEGFDREAVGKDLLIKHVDELRSKAHVEQ